MDNKIYIKNGFKGYYLKDKKFHYWTVLEKSKAPKRLNHNAYWTCQCICGKIKDVMARALVFNSSTNCGCIALKNRRLEFGIAAKNRLFLKYKQQAKRRGILFSLNLEDFLKITSTKCFYCNSTPYTFLGKRREDSLYGYYKYNGIDRVDNEKDYSLENSVPCCTICNRMKGTFTQEIFLKQVRKIHKQTLKNKKNQLY